MMDIDTVVRIFGGTPDEWARHSNGGGWVRNTAHVDESAYVGPDAVIYGTAHICGTAVVGGVAYRRTGGRHMNTLAAEVFMVVGIMATMTGIVSLCSICAKWGGADMSHPGTLIVVLFAVIGMVSLLKAAIGPLQK